MEDYEIDEKPIYELPIDYLWAELEAGTLE